MSDPVYFIPYSFNQVFEVIKSMFKPTFELLLSNDN